MNIFKYSTAGVFLLVIGLVFALGFAGFFSPDNAEDGGEKSVYTVREHEGKVAVFVNEESQPTQVLDVYVDSLPYSDAQQLKAGIRITSREKLQRLIEDYDG